MKSLFSRFKPATPGPSSRQSLDAPSPAPGPEYSDDTVKVSKSRSFRRARLPEAQSGAPTPTSGPSDLDPTSHYSSASHSSTPKDLPPRPVTPGSLSTLGPPLPPKDHLDLPSAVEEWRVGALHAQHGTDNVKKVAFQSPQRPYAANSEGDLRARAASAAAGPSVRQLRTRRASSPSKSGQAHRVSPTPRDLSHSRCSSRGSVHDSGAGLVMRRGSASTSQVSLGQLPSKSVSSLTLAASESSAASAQSYIPLPESWSAAMDDELIANLGPRERARQEVLWEIVNSEERYVQELAKLNETFCTALLPEREAEPLALPDPLALARTTSASSGGASHDLHDFGLLPIASQYSAPRQSTDSFRSEEEANNARMTALAALTKGSGQPSQPSQPPNPANNTHTSHSTSHSNSLGSRSHSSQARTLAKKKTSRSSLQGMIEGHSRITSRSSMSSVINGPVTLPDDLEQVLTVISNGILKGHLKLVEALRRRYDEQFPLVRSLADVFTSHSDILREYATYILHLERALAQIDEAAAMSNTIATGSRSRRSSRRLEETPVGRLGKTLQGLEELAAQRGEAGLAISLSKPFQRLLKYPLLFQNLLFNTSPSTREYEATLAMVDEVQTIVRSIEDEKSSSEERERARDAWARIEGIERNKALMAPKPSRLLVSETMVPATEKKGKSSHRLSDILKHRNAEQWIVRFTDVSLLCERTGYTSLPMSTKSGLKSESQTDLSIRRMSSSKRGQSLKQRNMYRFMKVHEWHERAAKPETPPPRLSLDYHRTSLDAIALRRKSVDHYRRPSLDHHPTLDNLLETPRATGSAVVPRKVPLKTVDGSPNKLTPRRRASSPTRTDDAQSEVMSVMSFAFRGEARPLGVRHASLGRTAALGTSGRTSVLGGSVQRATAASAQRAAKTMTMAERRNSASMSSTSAAANAKFAHRLRSSDELATAAPTVRPASRVRRSLPPAMALAPSGRRTATPAARPPWNSSMRPISAREERESEPPRVRPPSASSKPSPGTATAPLPLTSNAAHARPGSKAGMRPDSAARSRSSASEREPLADAANGKDKEGHGHTRQNSSFSGKSGKGKLAAVSTGGTAGSDKAVVGQGVNGVRKSRQSDIENKFPAEDGDVSMESQKSALVGAAVSRTNANVSVEAAEGKTAAKALTGVAARIAALERRNLGGHI